MKSARSLEFDPAGFDDLAWWIQQDRIDREHRLIYEVSEIRIRVLACRYHYRDRKRADATGFHAGLLASDYLGAPAPAVHCGSVRFQPPPSAR